MTPAGPRFRYDPSKGPQRLLTTADVIHVRGLSVDFLNGLSAVSQAARVIGLSDELVKHALSLLRQSATKEEVHRPAGILRLGTADMGPQPPRARTREKREVSRPRSRAPRDSCCCRATSSISPISEQAR